MGQAKRDIQYFGKPTIFAKNDTKGEIPLSNLIKMKSDQVVEQFTREETIARLPVKVKRTIYMCFNKSMGF